MPQWPSLDDPAVWCTLVEAAGPASILVAIRWRLGTALRDAAEDLWQETLLRAWEARNSIEWQGSTAFRAWLMTVAAHCVEDFRRATHAQRRDIGRTQALAGSAAGARGAMLEPWRSTTPSRVAVERERARAMEAALEALDDDVREVVRLRLIEDQPIVVIAGALGLGESAVRHRLRTGAESFRRRLRVLLEASQP